MDGVVAVDVPFQEFVDLLLKPQSADALGSGELTHTAELKLMHANTLM